MRRTDRAVRRGTSLQGSDRTAGDSSPVTQRTAGSGDARGRPTEQVRTRVPRRDPLDRTASEAGGATPRRRPRVPALP
ncbi:hypothetical protein SAM23877_4597 [Streptomyces ambofaciens ATCC 23877]|uniref:Uncharacterized protein n=1 Tax=Streptomyces ambofaciens (strain ATCC 23877 / 3486 / DSM 40053 / JCM 4204 / NBRC 12836 / NRRL B-2516) TaxID=278992 RepID=A0A0K2AXU7_STRA7|nr:hypothetical protein SAM23877_4597 [Streptomyces ambofaciens ATCC 23877]